MAKTIMTKANLLYPRLPTRPVIRRPGNPVYRLWGLAIGNWESVLNLKIVSIIVDITIKNNYNKIETRLHITITHFA